MIAPTRGRRVLGVATLVVLTIVAASLAAPASAQPDLYSATVIVTGRDNLAERARGIREALPLVLAKVSADPVVAARATADGTVVKSGMFVEGFDYRDRKEGIQISDEQGTRERSFELTVRFDPAEIDAVLGELGAEPWTGPRPEIGVALLVTDTTSAYVLTRGSQKGYGQRMALDDAARALGLTVRLPEALPRDAEISGVARSSPVRLEGRMAITGAGYWNTGWRLTANGLDERFDFADATFDAAIGGALRRSAKTLAKR